MTPQTRNDTDYLRRRHAQHVQQAQRATDEKARAVHNELAERFAAQIDKPA